MLTSLRSRLLMTYLAVILTVLVVVALALTFFLMRTPFAYRYFYAQQEVTMQIIRQRILEASRGRSSLEESWPEIERLARTTNTRVLVYDADGRLLFDSSPTEPTLSIPEHHMGRGQIVDPEGQTWLYVSQALPSGGRVVMGQPMPKDAALRILTDEGLWVPLLEAGLLALALSLVLAWLLSRWVARPLYQTADAARALAQGEYRPIAEEGPQEARILARAFNEMARQVEASQRSQREFVANVSHELKTPLTSIQGFAQAIIDGTADDPESVRTSAQIIAEEAVRMHRLVVTLLDLARLDAGTADLKREPLSLKELLEAVLTRFRPRAQKAQIALTFQAADDVTLMGDADRLAQVFINLIDNALRHTEAGGEVRIAIRRAGSWAEVQVSDTGKGIPPEQLPHIFERFYRGDKARSGRESAGLGLAIAQEIVRAHGGEIVVQSTPGKGSTFVVKLPLAPQP